MTRLSQPIRKREAPSARFCFFGRRRPAEWLGGRRRLEYTWLHLGTGMEVIPTLQQRRLRLTGQVVTGANLGIADPFRFFLLGLCAQLQSRLLVFRVGVTERFRKQIGI